MTIRATLIATIGEIASAQAAISEEERRLASRRAKLDRTMAETLTTLSDIEAAESAEEAAREEVPFSPGFPAGMRRQGVARTQIGARRRYMSVAVEACRDIILAIGRPSTIHEIHAAHPDRAKLPLHALYKALDQRARYLHPEFVTRNGVFWVADRPLPEGWVHPKGTPWEVVPITSRTVSRKRLAEIGGTRPRKEGGGKVSQGRLLGGKAAGGSADPARSRGGPRDGPGYPEQATFLKPEEQSEFGVGTAHELVERLNSAWAAEGRRPLARGSFPTSRVMLQTVLHEARLAGVGTKPPA